MANYRGVKCQVPFINKSEATKKSGDRKENGKCTNATNSRSRVGLSTLFYTSIPYLRAAHIYVAHIGACHPPASSLPTPPPPHYYPEHTL